MSRAKAIIVTTIIEAGEQKIAAAETSRGRV